MKQLFLMVLCVLSLSACGGGGGGASSNPTVSGTASQGAPIVGSVTLKDSKGASKSAAINSVGGYSVDVTGMTAPYIMKAGNFYSVVDSATTANVNPLTDMCTRTAAGTTSVDNIFANPTLQLATLATNLPTVVSNLKTNLNSVYPASVPATQRDFMNGSLTIDRGVDLVLKNISIEASGSGFTIKYNSQVLISVSVVGNTATIMPNTTNLGSFANVIAIGSSIITDPATGLVWQTSDDNVKRNWYDATSYCSNLNLGGYSSGWYLPSSAELQGLNNSSIFSQIGGTHFADLGGGNYEGSYWSSTNYNSTTAFHIFLTAQGASGYADKQGYTNLVRCVRPVSSVTTPPSSGPTSSAYSKSDLTGTWYFFQVNADSTNQYWARATLSVDANAVAIVSNSINSNGRTGSLSTIQLAITSDGIVTGTDSGSDQSTRFFMTKNKQLMVGTGGTPVDKSLYFMVKSGTGFVQSDLQGTWSDNGLKLKGTSTSTTNQFKWQRENLNINSAGLTTFTNIKESLAGGINTVSESPLTMSLNSKGIISISGFPSFYGVLSLDKNLIIATHTNSDGSVGIILMTRSGGTAFTNADMQGAWRTNYLGLKDFYWGRALTTFNDSGLGSITQILQSNGTRSDMSGQFSLAINGVLTAPTWGAEAGVQTFGGIMSLDKNMMIGTVTQDALANPNPSMFIWVK
jgi:hypothetical protein